MKQSRIYVPTETDRLTGENVRRLRRLAGETLVETIEGSGVDFAQSSLSRIELGQRPLSLPDATKLAAHWNTTADRIIRQAPFATPLPPVRTEQSWLGNDKPPTLFAVPERAEVTEPRESAHTRPPLTPEQYRAQVWIPYLENRYTTEQKAG